MKDTDGMTMATLRRWHFYLGMLIAPSVLFFALTGAVQLFSLHEAHDGYVPPPLIEKLSAVHKDQVFASSRHHGPPPGAKPAGPAAASPPDEDGPKHATLALKAFFLVVALGLAASTALGVWIGLTRAQHRQVGWGLLAVGAILPVVLLLV